MAIFITNDDFHWGVAGVAWATCIAQGCAAILALITMFVRLRHVANEKQPFVDKKLLWQIIQIAVPSIIQQSVLSVCNPEVPEFGWHGRLGGL